MSKVFVLDAHKRPLNPVHPGRARLLLTQGRAAVFRHYPFTIVLKQEGHQPDSAPLRLKIDPGSTTTGLAIVNEATGEVVWAAELTHRGTAIQARLEARRVLRRSRRRRKTRHRAPRFLNRRRPEAWLPPSLLTVTTCIPATSCGYRRQTAMLTHDSAPASWADAPFPSGLNAGVPWRFFYGCPDPGDL
jgi:hypothetical protein